MGGNGDDDVQSIAQVHILALAILGHSIRGIISRNRVRHGVHMISPGLIAAEALASGSRVMVGSVQLREFFGLGHILRMLSSMLKESSAPHRQ